MNIEVLLTEAEISKEFTESLEAHDLPEKFFYWLPLSVQAWRELYSSSAGELDSLWSLVNAYAAELAGGFQEAVPVVSLGSGEGARDRAFLKALQRSGKAVKYFPVDASQSLLEAACAAAEDDDLEVMGIKADISSPMHMVLASDAAESPKVFLLSGNTLAGFDPMDQLRHIKEVMRKGDRLILDAELYSPDSPMEDLGQYAKFAMAPLASLGVQDDDGSIRFETKQDQRRAGMSMITKYFQAHRDLRIGALGGEISVARGERIFMNFRYRFTLDAFQWLLKEHAGFVILREFLSPNGLHTASVCSC